MDDVNRSPVETIKDATRWFNDLSMAAKGRLDGTRPASRMLRKMFDALENSPHKFACGIGLVESDVIRNSVEIG